MNTEDGFAPILILVIVVAALTLGGILWVHYSISHDMASSIVSSSTQPSVTSTEIASTSQPSNNSTTTITGKTSANPQNHQVNTPSGSSASAPNPPRPLATTHVSAANLATSDPGIEAGNAIVIETNNMTIEATNVTDATITGVVSLSGVNKNFSLSKGESITEFGYSITLAYVLKLTGANGKPLYSAALHIVKQ